MNPRIIVMTALALLVGAAFFRSPAPTELVESAAREVPTARAPSGDGRVLAAAVPTPKVGPSAKLTLAGDLARFQELHAKVVLDQREQDSLTLLRNNADLLAGLGEMLRTPANDPSVLARQDAALDLLFEALREGDRLTAAETLRGVVRDTQVEDEHLPRERRESLAGIKGEVLYQWTALAPEQKNSLVQMLPGPVSRRVWANVEKMRTDHATESFTEARTNAQ